MATVSSNSVPSGDPLLAAIPPETRDVWRKNPTKELMQRWETLHACGPRPSCSMQARRLAYWRATRAAWETYVFCAFACGLLEKPLGNNLQARLKGRDADGFRSAMAECLACWFLAGRLGLRTCGDAAGRDRKRLDMQVVLCGHRTGVEVKAPYRELEEGAWSGDDSDKIYAALHEANKQLPDSQPNLVVLVPKIRVPLSVDRGPLLRAAFGQSVITGKVDTTTGQAGSIEVKFRPDGKFLNTRQPSGNRLKPDGLPAYRRISAIVCIEEHIVERKQVFMDHDVLIMHNPHAYYALPRKTWLDYPQLVPDGKTMRWTDGEEAIV